MYNNKKISGTLNLTNLRLFLPGIEHACRRGGNGTVIDLSGIEYWDPAALLWFSLYIKQLRDEGLSVQLRLPDPDATVEDETSQRGDAAQRSADFLKRWRFDVVLRRIEGRGGILVDEQKDYFSRESLERARYYKARKVVEPSGEVSELMSESLFPFFDFSAIEYVGRGSGDSREAAAGDLPQRWPVLKISRTAVNDKFRRLMELAAAGVFTRNTKLSQESSEAFVRRIVGEALDNMERHPGASFGMMAMNREDNNSRLVLAVVDNGESICETILDVFNRQFGKKHSFEDVRRNPSLAAKVLDYSTQRQVTSKPDGNGMGLYYMKRYVLSNFKGTLKVLTAGVECTYQGEDFDAPPSYKVSAQTWNGNLLRIDIPIEGTNE